MSLYPTDPWSQSLTSMGVALGVGLLVGLEREQFQSKAELRRFGGIRTFGLLSLAGAVGGTLEPDLGWWMPALIGLLVGITLVGSLFFDRDDEEARGYTTVMAGLVVHFLGILAAVPITDIDPVHRWGLCAAGGLATMTLLSLRNPLHQLAERVSSADLYATAKLGVLLLVVLPLLPNRQVGPIPQFNPFEVGLLVALISGIGFVGYLAVRFLGSQRGMTLTGFVGGLASSTAVTLNFAGRVREEPGLASVAALGIVLAGTVMYARQLVEIAVVSPGLIPAAIVPLGLMGLTGLTMTGVFYWRYGRTSREHTHVELRNPFSLDQAIKFALIYVIVLVMSDLALKTFGTTGLYLSSFLAGFNEVSAITLTIARLHREGLAADHARLALVLAATSNTLTKSVLAMSIGGWKLGYRVIGIFLPMVVVGALVIAIGLSLPA